MLAVSLSISFALQTWLCQPFGLNPAPVTRIPKGEVPTLVIEITERPEKRKR